MRAIDTNVLVRLIVRDDVRQAALAENFVEGGAWVSVLALTEAVWVLSTVYELTHQQLVQAIEMLADHQDLVLQEHEAVETALALFRQKPSLGFSDCMTIELARKSGHLPLGTFDRGLARIDGARKL